MIPIKDDSICVSGYDSIIAAMNYYYKDVIKEKQNLIEYNRIDCETIFYIIRYLRLHHVK